MQITFNKTQSHKPCRTIKRVQLNEMVQLQCSRLPIINLWPRRCTVILLTSSSLVGCPTRLLLFLKMHSRPLDILFLSVFVILWEAIHTIMAIAAVEHHVLEMFWERGLSILWATDILPNNILVTFSNISFLISEPFLHQAEARPIACRLLYCFYPTVP